MRLLHQYLVVRRPLLTQLSHLMTLTCHIFRTIKFCPERIIENAVLDLPGPIRVHFPALTYKIKYLDNKIGYVASVSAF